MLCFKCGNETDFETAEVAVLQHYLGCVLKVMSPVTVCKECGWESLGDGQLNELLKRTKAAHAAQADKDHWFKTENL